MTQITVRAFQESDVPELLELMRGLARFEGYIDDFKVTEKDLVRFGLRPEPAFESFVAETPGLRGLTGMVVLYRIPWTYDLRPTLVMKELFVRKDARGKGIGQALLRRVAHRAQELNCPRLLWTVLPSNDSAKRFYARAGATQDQGWEHWQLNKQGLADLTQDRGLR